MTPVDQVCPGEIPQATFAAACRWWEAFLEDKYPGTKWHVRRKSPEAAPDGS